MLPWFFDELSEWLVGALAFLLVFGRTLLKTVSDHLAKRWGVSLGEWIDEKVVARVTRFDTKYRKHLEHRHRNFDVKGLSTQNIYNLALQHVYVELIMAPASRASANPVPSETPENVITGSHPIWAFLKAWDQRAQNLAILGAPGSGKTTLLKHVALILALRNPRRLSDVPRGSLPVLLFLRDLVRPIKENSSLTLTEAIEASLKVFDLEPAPRFFRSRLKTGRCLVMLDGLDEVAMPEDRQKVRDWVEAQMAAYGDCQFVVTSRPFGYLDNPLEGVTVLEMKPFNSVQIASFVHNWCLENEIMASLKDDQGVRDTAREGAEDLLKRLRSTPTLSEIAVNPLLLTLIAAVHRYRSSLPERRVELYKEICEVCLGKRQQARGLQLDLTPAQKQRVLECLAFHMMREHQREIEPGEAILVIRGVLGEVSPASEPRDFLKTIENSSGLLVERETGVYGFSHLSFQEYLAAVHVQRNSLVMEWASLAEDSWWHEMIRLFVAQSDATPVLESCLIGNPPTVSAVVLGVECLEEAERVNPELRRRFEEMLSRGLDDADARKRRLVAESLLSVSLRRMIRLDENRYLGSSLVSNAEYQIFLDELRQKGEYRQPDHWAAYQYEKGEGNCAVTGVRALDARAFCEWLTSREQNDWQFRLPCKGRPDEIAVLDPKQSEACGFWAENSGSNSIVGVPATTIEAYRSAVGRERVFDLAFPRNRYRDLPPNLPREGSLAWDIDSVAFLDRMFGFAGSRMHHLDIALARAHDLDLALDLDLAFPLALPRALPLAVLLALNRDLACSYDRARSLGRVHLFDFDCARNRARSRALARALDLDLDRCVTQISRAPSLARWLEERDRAEALNGLSREGVDACWPEIASFLCLGLATLFLYSGTVILGLQENLGTSFLPVWMRQQDVPDFSTLADGFLASGCYLAILQRVMGNELNPLGGVRLIRERRGNHTSLGGSP